MELSERKVNWEEVRADLGQGHMTYVAVRAKHGISRPELADHIRTHKWEIPERDDERDFLIRMDALFLALERQMQHIKEVAMEADASKQVVVLSKLASTLDQLARLDAGAARKRPTARQSKELAELRAKIARRLDVLGVN